MSKKRFWKVTKDQARRHGLVAGELVEVVKETSIKGVHTVIYDGFKTEMDLSDDGEIDLKTTDHWQ